MRHTTQNLLSASVFGLLALENIGLQGYSLPIVVSAVLAGAVLGFINSRTETRAIQSKGQYHPRLVNFLALVALAISTASISLYAVAVGMIGFRTLVSGFVFAPALFLGSFIVGLRWERRTGREIYSIGSWNALGTLYAVPRGMTWIERTNYMQGQKELLRNERKVTA